jgi:2-oxo-4-hydroxy-4-carboxy-5-ureidoimidazoline decarboxylase
MDKIRYKISEINSLSKKDFVELIGPVFEHSPWIAEAAVGLRPLANLESLNIALYEIVFKSSEAKQIALIQAHPDLVGRAAQEESLTAESTREQAGAGLGNLDFHS